MVSSDFKRFIKYSYNLHDHVTHITYIAHIIYITHSIKKETKKEEREERRKRQKTKESLKILLKKKKKKSVSIIMNVIKIFPGNTKKKLIEYRRNYYMAHNKLLLGHSVDFLKILGQLSFLFHGLVLEILKIF